jgi:hypothetical protein
MKRAVVALLIGANIEVWATSKEGNYAKFQHGAHNLMKVCGCVDPEPYGMFGVKGAKDGALILMDSKGKLHYPSEPCSSGRLQDTVNFFADMSKADPKARLLYAYWDLEPSDVKQGYFITNGDTIEVRRP